MERGLFNIEIVFKLDGKCEHLSIENVAFSDIQKHIPVAANVVSLVAKRQRAHKI